MKCSQICEVLVREVRLRERVIFCLSKPYFINPILNTKGKKLRKFTVNLLEEEKKNILNLLSPLHVYFESLLNISK